MKNMFLSAKNNLKYYKKLVFSGFTLAEALITLGIIGIVAALTIPQLMTNYKKKETANAVKKAYSEFSQVLKLAEVNNGEMAYWDYPADSSIEENQKFIENYIIKYYKGVTRLENGKNPDGWNGVISKTAINFVSANGTIFSMKATGNDKRLVLLIDTNGFKRPNKMGTDMFYFEVYGKNGKLIPFGWKDGLTREMILDGYQEPKNPSIILACKPPSEETDNSEIKIYTRYACTSLLMLDGWEFKKDYPWSSSRSGAWE